MRFCFVRPGQYSQWGGDVKAVLDLQEGLQELGHDSFLTDDVTAGLSADQIFFMGTLLDQSPYFYLMRLLGRPYGCIPFHPFDGKETQSFRTGRNSRSSLLNLK